MIAKTPFIDGLTLSYPIGYFPDLFKCVNARTKKSFIKNLMDYENEKKGGEGVPEDVLIEMFRVGLLHIKPACTFEEAQDSVQSYLVSFGPKKLDEKLVDAFVDSGIYDREYVEKQRKFAAELEKINEERESALIRKAQSELRRLNDSIDQMISKAISEKLIDETDIPRKEEQGQEKDTADDKNGDMYNVAKGKLVKPSGASQKADPSRVKSNRRKPKPGQDPLEPPEILP